mgnify:CR=1 FL=1
MYQSSKLIHTGSHDLKEYFTKHNKTRTWLTKLISKSLYTRIRRYNLYVYSVSYTHLTLPTKLEV